MHIFATKLRTLKASLKIWIRLTFGNVHDATTMGDRNLKEIQSDIQNLGYSKLLQEKETKAQLELEKALYMEEELWREKSHINWNLQGDRNLNFFHTYAKIKRKTKLISSLIINDKKWKLIKRL